MTSIYLSIEHQEWKGFFFLVLNFHWKMGNFHFTTSSSIEMVCTPRWCTSILNEKLHFMNPTGSHETSMICLNRLGLCLDKFFLSTFRPHYSWCSAFGAINTEYAFQVFPVHWKSSKTCYVSRNKCFHNIYRIRFLFVFRCSVFLLYNKTGHHNL